LILSAKNEMIQIAQNMQDKELEEALKQRFAPHAPLEQRFRLLIQADQQAPGGPFLD